MRRADGEQGGIQRQKVRSMSIEPTEPAGAPPSTPVRVALLGYGASASRLHRPLIDATDGIELVAVIPTSGRAEESVRRESPRIAIIRDVDGLRPLEIDLVVVATPDVAHFADALRAIEAGFAVVVEKPFATTVRDANRLADASTRAGVLLAPFQNRRWDSDFLTLQGLLDAGRLGSVFRFESRIARWSPQVGTAWRDHRRDGSIDGRLADLGSHLVDQALALFGPVGQVYGEMRAVRSAAAANDDVFAAMQHISGVTSHIHMSSVWSASAPRFIAQGLGGSYTKFGLDPQEHQLRASTTPGSEGWGVDSNPGIFSDGNGERRETSVPGDWRDFYRGIVATLRLGDRFAITPADAVATVVVLEAVRVSAAQRRTVEIHPPELLA